MNKEMLELVRKISESLLLAESNAKKLQAFEKTLAETLEAQKETTREIVGKIVVSQMKLANLYEKIAEVSKNL